MYLHTDLEMIKSMALLWDTVLSYFILKLG